MAIQHELYKPLVLCVDDNEWLLKLTRQVLESKGYRVLTASNGSAALKVFSSCSLDAVILDYDMPGMSGGEVALEMTRINPKVPKLLFSSATSIPGEQSRAFQGYCPKPNGAPMLASQVHAMTAVAMGA